MNDSTHFYRRRLPHYRELDTIYFVTWRLAPSTELSAPERDLVAAELHHRHEQRYELYAYVVMNDHVHVLLRILDEEPLEKIIHSWKSFTAHAMQRRHGRRGQVWQDEYFDRIVRDEKELLEKYDHLEDPNDPNLMLQEFIPGGDDSVWMFNGYFNAQSDCLVGFTGRKLRQYPVYVGMTALGICLENEFVDKTTRNFMKQIGYRGILDIGYRYDRRDGQYKLLDVNPRIGATFRLFVGDNGLDVVRALYLDLTGQSVPRSNLCEGRKWVVEDNDFISFRNYRKDGKLTFREWVNSFHGVQETAWFAWDDPLPFFIRCGSFLSYLFRWFTKKLRFSAPKVPETSAQPQ